MAAQRNRTFAQLLLTIMLCSTPVMGENWVKTGSFHRYVLYVDEDSVVWGDTNCAEVVQKTILTEAGRTYFREGYKRSGRAEAPPAQIIAKERYFRDRRHKTLSVTFLDSQGTSAFEASNVPFPQQITPGSPYASVWEYLFVKDRPDRPRLKATGPMPATLNYSEISHRANVGYRFVTTWGLAPSLPSRILEVRQINSGGFNKWL